VASIGICPCGLGWPTMFSVGLSPVGGGNVGHWKWRNTSFPRGCWKSFPTGLLEMEEVQGRRHFQISKAIFMDMKGGPGRLDVADASLGMGRTFKQGACRSLSFGIVQSLIDPSRLTLGRFLVLVPIDQDLRN
jgi:hypothetical protein